MEEPLKQELAAYTRLKDGLLAQEGKFAVIFKDDLLGVYGSYEDALKIGYEKCGLQPFLVKKIQAIEPVNYFSRSVFAACHT